MPPTAIAPRAQRPAHVFPKGNTVVTWDMVTLPAGRSARMPPAFSRHTTGRPGLAASTAADAPCRPPGRWIQLQRQRRLESVGSHAGASHPSPTLHPPQTTHNVLRAPDERLAHQVAHIGLLVAPDGPVGGAHQRGGQLSHHQAGQHGQRLAVRGHLGGGGGVVCSARGRKAWWVMSARVDEAASHSTRWQAQRSHHFPLTGHRVRRGSPSQQHGAARDAEQVAGGIPAGGQVSRIA